MPESQTNWLDFFALIPDPSNGDLPTLRRKAIYFKNPPSSLWKPWSRSQEWSSRWSKSQPTNQFNGVRELSQRVHWKLHWIRSCLAQSNCKILKISFTKYRLLDILEFSYYAQDSGRFAWMKFKWEKILLWIAFNSQGNLCQARQLAVLSSTHKFGKNKNCRINFRPGINKKDILSCHPILSLC